MCSETPNNLPEIDFSVSDLKPGTSEWDSVKSQVHKAIQDYGCFMALHNKIPPELQKATFCSMEEVFNLPSETKMHNLSDNSFHRSFITWPLYESIALEDANLLEWVERSTNALWPDGNPNFSNNINSYVKQVSELDQIIKRMILEILSLDKYLDELMNSTYYHLKLIKYDSPQSTEKEIALMPHVDSNLISILYQLNEVNGLEVQTKDGVWIYVKASPHSFIVLIGESLTAWTNGRLNPVRHRVVMGRNKKRYTMGLFSLFKPGYIVRAPKEMVDEEHPLLYGPYDYSKFRTSLKSRGGKRPDFPLKEFYGL